ncbi:MAG TPA: hypothetical protein VNO50_08505 [Pyrinomonadaceae bacterium]|nr:hypothetical protein [Pyrinomonadaceae bacterium]
MRSLIALAVFLAVLALPVKTGTAQETIMVASPAARTRNHATLHKLIGEYNHHALEFNKLVGGKTEWEVEPEKAAEHAAESALKLNEIYKVLTHFDEEAR